MPTIEKILNGLKDIVRTWRAMAVLWHAYFAVFIVALILGLRPSRRPAGILLGLPLLSVSILAWISANRFNGIVFGLISIL